MDTIVKATVRSFRSCSFYYFLSQFSLIFSSNKYNCTLSETCATRRINHQVQVQTILLLSLSLVLKFIQLIRRRIFAFSREEEKREKRKSTQHMHSRYSNTLEATSKQVNSTSRVGSRDTTRSGTLSHLVLYLVLYSALMGNQMLGYFRLHKFSPSTVTHIHILCV